MPSIHEQWLTTLEAATRDAFDRMAMIDIEVGDHTLLSDVTEKIIVMGMSLSGDHPAEIELCLSTELAAIWSSACAGVDVEELDTEEIEDGVGELLNMIAGAAKTALGEFGTIFDVGIPTGKESRTLGIENSKIDKEILFKALADAQPLEIAIRLP